MAVKTKKVVLFIVEGLTDEDSLSPILKKIFHGDEVRFHVVHGDMTSAFSSTRANAVKTVNAHIEIERKRYGFDKKDIVQVIHLIDTDGAFIPDDYVVPGTNASIRYFDNRIEARVPRDIIHRNRRKTQIVQLLCATCDIGKIPYQMYYFSRNLEHILHNDSSHLTKDEKLDYADSFTEKYCSDPASFVDFLSSSEFAAEGNFESTWDFIMEDLHSLQRYCNFHLLFQKGGKTS